MRLRIFSAIGVMFLGILYAHASNPRLTYLSGNSVPFNALQGKWVFINYWASWCQPCLEEIETFNRFYQDKKNNVAFFAVNYESLPKEQQQSLIEKLHIQYPSLEDPAKQLRLGNIAGVPTTFVFDPKGQLNRVLYGPQTISKLNQILEGKSMHPLSSHP